MSHVIEGQQIYVVVRGTGKLELKLPIEYVELVGDELVLDGSYFQQFGAYLGHLREYIKTIDLRVQLSSVLSVIHECNVVTPSPQVIWLKGRDQELDLRLCLTQTAWRYWVEDESETGDAKD